MLRIKPPHKNELNRLLKISNDVAKSHGQLPLYSEPETRSMSFTSRKRDKGIDRKHHRMSPYLKPERLNLNGESDMSSKFHISIGWALFQPQENPNFGLGNMSGDHDSDFHLSISCLKVKIGNCVTEISFSFKAEASNMLVEP